MAFQSYIYIDKSSVWIQDVLMYTHLYYWRQVQQWMLYLLAFDKYHLNLLLRYSSISCIYLFYQINQTDQVTTFGYMNPFTKADYRSLLVLLHYIYQIMLTIFLTMLLLTLSSQANVNDWTFYTDIRTGRVDLFNSTGGILTSSSVAPSYNVIYSSAISQTLSSGLGIVGFQTSVTNSFSINMTISNFLTTTMRITGRVQDDTIVTYLSVNYIAVGSKTYFLDVQLYCFLPTILSTGSGIRTETKTGITALNNLGLQCNVYLSGFRLSNTVGINNYLSSSVTCSSGSSNLNYIFKTSQSNLVSQICYTTVIFCDTCTKASTYYMQWGQIGQTSLNNTYLPSASNIQTSTFFRYQKDDRMFWGISLFNVSRGFVRGFNFQTNYYSITGGTIDTNYGTYNNSGTYQIGLNHFYIATRDCNQTDGQYFQVPTQTCQDNNSCWSNLTYTLNGSNEEYCNYCDYTCLTCSGSLSTNCTNCSNTTFRFFNNSNSCPCQSGYIDIGLVSCNPCEYYIFGCITCSSTSICTSCISGFELDLLGQCKCTTGYLVTGVCTTIKGCISATNYQGSVSCLDCNTTYNYIISNFTCVCASGFSMNSAQNCENICGDSVTVSGQGCDDGNMILGDGCNNECQVQTNFYCDNTSPPSICYIIANVTAKLKYVQRVLTANRATFAIELSPKFDQYPNMDFPGYVSTDMPCAQSTYLYSNDILIFNCSYSQTIEGNNYMFNLTLDPRYFAHTTVSLVLPASGMNAKLTYDSNYGMYTPLQMMVLVLDIVAIIVLLISCVSERMIGVEMIQTLQSVLYAMALMKSCPSTLAPLQSLSYSNGYNEVNGADPIRRYTYTFTIGQVGLDQQFLLNYNISYFILILVIVVLLVFKVLMAKFELDKENEERQFNRRIEMDQMHKSYKYIKKAYKIVFQRIFFILCFMNMFLVMFAVGVQFSRLTPDYYVMSSDFNTFLCGIAICILVTFLTMVNVNGCYPVIRIFPMFMDQKYPVHYVIYNSTFIMLITYLYTKPWLIFLLLSMAIANLIYSLIYTPYKQKLHNLTLAINQGTIILAIGAYLYEDLMPYANNNEGIFTILVLIIIVMLYLCVFLSMYRLYRFYQYMKINKLSYDNEADNEQSQKNAKNPLRENQNDIQMIENEKVQGLKTSKALQPFQKEMYQDSKINKGPLNAARFNNDNVETNREKNSLAKSRINNEQNYDTFSKNKSKNNSFQIDPIDPNPRELRGLKSPYNQFGQLKIHNHKDEEEQKDALKEIKARLRKDFYHKVRQTQYKDVSQKEQLLNKKNNKPANFEPSDYHDD